MYQEFESKSAARATVAAGTNSAELPELPTTDVSRETSVDPAAVTGDAEVRDMPDVRQKPGVRLAFGLALVALKGGGRVARDGWNGKGMYLELQRPDAGSKMTLPYIFMRTVQGDLVPWLASQTDLLAEDWAELG